MVIVGSIKPYNHDCSICKWVGWFSPWSDKPPMNVYLCRDMVIIRFSDEPSDYWSMPIGGSKQGDLGFISQESYEKAIAAIKERKLRFEED